MGGGRIMNNVSYRESLSRECRIGSHIFAGINGEGMGRWSVNGGKTAPSGGEYGAHTGVITRSKTVCGEIAFGREWHRDAGRVVAISEFVRIPKDGMNGVGKHAK